MSRLMLCYIAICDPSLAIVQQCNIDPQINDTIVNIRNDSDNIVTLNRNMKIITVNNYKDFLCDFPVSKDILPPLSEKDFNLSGLDSKMKKRLFQLVTSHKSAFARSTVELSVAATEHHRIHLQHDYPIKCPIYKIPFNLRNEFRHQIADLEKAGIISKSKSPYNTPALFVKQKKWRLFLDFRKLNEITLTQDFAIPTLDDILHEISASNYFSALDMKHLIKFHFTLEIGIRRHFLHLTDTPFVWTSETQETFDDIKETILNPPVLALPDPNADIQMGDKIIRTPVKKAWPISKTHNAHVTRTVQRELHASNLYGRVGIRKPLVTARHALQQRQWCRSTQTVDPTTVATSHLVG
ncbi:zinc finger protein 90 [Trichonephila clavipes]|nr:zinc finger protein 90 [Trichonephila clavipes]